MRSMNMCRVIGLVTFVLLVYIAAYGDARRPNEIQQIAQPRELPDDRTLESLRRDKFFCLSELIGKFLSVRLVPNGFKEHQSMRETFDKSALECASYFEEIIESNLQKLGLIGRSIRHWMTVLDRQARAKPSSRAEDLVGALETDLVEMHQGGQPSSHKGKEIAGTSKGPEPTDEVEDIEKIAEMLLDAENYPLVHKVLWRAMMSGRGICVHMKDEPFRYIDTILSLILNESQARDIRLKLVAAITHTRAGPPKYPKLAQLLLLGRACKLLEDLMHPGDFTDNIGRHMSQMIKETIAIFEGQDGFFSKNEPLCKWEHFGMIADRFRYINDCDPEERETLRGEFERVANILISKCLAEYQPAIERATRDLMRLPDFEQPVKDLMLNIERAINFDETPSDDSILALLDPRTKPASSIVKTIFLDRNFEGFDLIQAYRDGSHMCDIFDSSEWSSMISSENPLTNLFELLIELYLTPMFKPTSNDETTRLFYLWKICNLVQLFSITD